MLWIVLAIVVVIAVWAIAKGSSARATDQAARAGYARAIADVREALAEDSVDLQDDEPGPVRSSPRQRGPRRPAVAPDFDYWAHPPGVLSSQAQISASLQSAPLSGPEVCFTGWPDVDEADLISRAQAAGFRVRTAVTKNLTVLCVGATPGPKKVEIAHAQGVAIVSGRTMEAIMDAWGQEVSPTQG